MRIPRLSAVNCRCTLPVRVKPFCPTERRTGDEAAAPQRVTCLTHATLVSPVHLKEDLAQTRNGVIHLTMRNMRWGCVALQRDFR